MLNKEKMKILIFVSYYLPGYKSGGQSKSVSNIVSNLSDDFLFSIVTGDRDIGDRSPYSNIKPDSWNSQSGCEIFYISEKSRSFSSFIHVLKKTNHDVVYLNSFFDFWYSIQVLFLIRVFNASSSEVLLAPRGELSAAALSIKKIKKITYLLIFKIFFRKMNITYQASSAQEKNDIVKVLGVSPEDVKISIDLPSITPPEALVVSPTLSLIPRIVFLSRICEIKNLDYAIKVLQKITYEVVFDIYGPIEDERYWQYCKVLLKNLPSNIKHRYCGPLEPHLVQKTFSSYDLLFLPTRSENFGHVIAESLSVGTMVLISDQTPWLSLSDDSLGWDIKLEDVDVFVARIKEFAGKSLKERENLREACLSSYRKRQEASNDVKVAKELFYNLSSNKETSN